MLKRIALRTSHTLVLRLHTYELVGGLWLDQRVVETVAARTAWPNECSRQWLGKLVVHVAVDVAVVVAVVKWLTGVSDRVSGRVGGRVSEWSRQLHSSPSEKHEWVMSGEVANASWFLISSTSHQSIIYWQLDPAPLSVHPPIMNLLVDLLIEM